PINNLSPLSDGPLHVYVGWKPKWVSAGFLCPVNDGPLLLYDGSGTKWGNTGLSCPPSIGPTTVWPAKNGPIQVHVGKRCHWYAAG
ncbi:unnamed protein product, partial [Allacma fusca]